MNDQQKIKAIETNYAGCRFRSRLEARWAVFLDTLGVGWEYEPQGFELPSGNRYLPDFWLPDAGAWIEVKGAQPDAREQAKIIELGHVVSKQGHRVRLLQGDIPRTCAVYFEDRDFTIPAGCIGIRGTAGAFAAFERRTGASIGAGPAFKRATDEIRVFRLPPGTSTSRFASWRNLEVLHPGAVVQVHHEEFIPALPILTPRPEFVFPRDNSLQPDGSLSVLITDQQDIALEHWHLEQAYWFPCGEDIDARVITEALTAARSARFEHGESGAPVQTARQPRTPETWDGRLAEYETWLRERWGR